MISPNSSKPALGSEIDALVVGAGIGGLLTSALLLQKGRKVHLTEKLPKIGGKLSPEKRSGYTLGAGFAFSDSAWWRSAADRIGLKSPTQPVAEGKALMHGARGWSAPEGLDSWEHFLSEPCTEFPAGGAYGIVEALLQFCQAQEGFSVSLECPLTKAEGVAGKIEKICLGTKHELRPKDVYWSADYKTLLEVLSGPGIPEAGPDRVSWMKPFRKTNPQPGVVLELAHKTKLGDFTETLLLPFPGEKGGKDYVVGAIVSNRDPALAPEGKSLSTWVIPLSEAEWGDNHESMKKIRAGRRLIEKAFPNLEANVSFDRVVVLDSTVTPLAKRKGEWNPLLPNLHLTADWAMPNGATLPSLAETLLQKL